LIDGAECSVFLLFPFLQFRGKTLDYGLRQSLSARLGGIDFHAQRLQYGRSLDACEEFCQRLQITRISDFERAYVLSPQISVNDKRKQVSPEKNQSYKRTADPSVAILIRVYLRKPVMKPGCHDNWVLIRVFSKPS